MLSTGFAAAISRLQNRGPARQRGAGIERATGRHAQGGEVGGVDLHEAEIHGIATADPLPGVRQSCLQGWRRLADLGGVVAQCPGIEATFRLSHGLQCRHGHRWRTADRQDPEIRRGEGCCPRGPRHPTRRPGRPSGEEESATLLERPDHHVFPSHRGRPRGAAVCIDHIKCPYVNNRCVYRLKCTLLRFRTHRHRKLRMARPKQFSDRRPWRFRRVTFAGHQGVTGQDEDRSDFIRAAVERESRAPPFGLLCGPQGPPSREREHRRVLLEGDRRAVGSAQGRRRRR